MFIFCFCFVSPAGSLICPLFCKEVVRMESKRGKLESLYPLLLFAVEFML